MYSPLNTNMHATGNLLNSQSNSAVGEEDSIRDIILSCEGLDSPAFIYDEEAIVQRCEYLRGMVDRAGCQLLYSLKPLTFVDVLELIAPYVDGFSVSSLFEAALARTVAKGERTVHLTSPGLRPDEMDRLVQLCDYISFNSISQWQRYNNDLRKRLNYGLRINPQRSFVSDARYDPCRENSKLGVPIQEIAGRTGANSLAADGLSGILLHANCDSPDVGELLTMVRQVVDQIGNLLPSFRWVNLGGGYLFEEEDGSSQQFTEAVQMLRSRYGLRVFVEPGSAVVREAGYLVSTVLDVLCNDDRSIAILDTSINHMPEVFEYQYLPYVLGASETGEFRCQLAGSTCLAGDIFGEYSFEEPLEVGSRVIFGDFGAYTLVKAHTFNGLNFPSIYALTAHGDLVLKKRFTFEEYARRWGMQPDAPDPNGI